MARSPVLRIVLINAVILLAGVLVLEAVFGNWLRPNRMNRLNLLRDVTIAYDATGLYPGGGTITYTRDQYGLRGRYRDPGSIDILTIGGSSTDQRYISDGQTWQDALRDAFAEHGMAVTVVNAGVDGQSTAGHIRNFDWWFPNVPGLKPRFNLFYLGVNDFVMQAAFDELVDTPTLMSRVRQSSALYALFQKVRGAYRAAVVARLGHARVDFAAETWTTVPLLRDHAAVMREPLERYRSRLRVLLARSAALGAQPICVTQAARYYRSSDADVTGVTRRLRFEGQDINGVDYFRLRAMMDEATLEMCREFNGMPIAAASEVPWADEDFYDFVHNTPLGAQKLGRFLYESLRGRLGAAPAAASNMVRSESHRP